MERNEIQGLLRSKTCGELRKENLNQTVVLCGWVNKNRDLGGLHFVDLRDKYGITQVSFDEFVDDLSILKKCYQETVLKITGRVALRPPEAINKDRSTGEIEVKALKLEILSECDIENIPFFPDGPTSASEDLRLKYRYLDLRGQALQNVLRKRSETMMRARNTLIEEDFIEVETPILYKSTPEGARDYVVPSRVHSGHVYALPQSPQTLKQLLMIGGTDKYFQICRCFRDEDLRADRQPEFSQIDIEVSFPTADYIKGLSEKLFSRIFDIPSLKLPLMSYDDALRDYGSDKPDIRFGLKHQICTSLFKDSPFAVFSSVANDSEGMIKTIFLPHFLGGLSRKEIDELVSVVKPHGGKGVAFFKVENGEVSGGISKFISPEILTQLEKNHSEEQDFSHGIWLFVADKEDIAHSSTDALRRHLGKKLNLHQEGFHFLWVYDFPLLEWDEELKRFFAKHHPFTSPKTNEISDFLEKDPTQHKELFKRMKAEAYDVVCNGYELGGGSIRIHNQAVQSKMFQVLGISEEEAKAQFGFFVEALKYGTPPHGGIAFGLDRILMILSKTDVIRDVMAFPKTNSATDLMSQSPSRPSMAQIEELHFHWNEENGE